VALRGLFFANPLALRQVFDNILSNTTTTQQGNNMEIVILAFCVIGGIGISRAFGIRVF
jgi:hypothetical protein